MRRARTAGDVRRRHAARYCSYRYDDDGSLVGSFRLPPEQAAVFLHGLDAARGRIQPLGSEGEPAVTDISSESPGQSPRGRHRPVVAPMRWSRWPSTTSPPQPKLANLISLCDAHHWAVHEGGFAILPRSINTWALISPVGVTVEPVPAPPAQPVSPLPHKQDLRDDAVSGTWDGTDLDVGYTTGLLNAPAATPARSASAEAPFDRDASIAGYLANLEAMDE